MSVKHIDDYKKIMNYLLFLETHRYPGTDHISPLQEDPEADTFIILSHPLFLRVRMNLHK